MPRNTSSERSRFHLILIKPTRYDGDGYPIQWLKSPLPANTLAVLNSLAHDASRRRILGADVSIVVSVYDETNQRIPVEQIIARAAARGTRTLVALVGVQSNQFPRALDLARRFRSADVPVCVGGFHVSGCVAMLPTLPPELLEAQQLGVSLFAGEAECGGLDEVIGDAWRGELRPLYNRMASLPGLEGAPVPHLESGQIARIGGSTSAADLGRGCPFKCSFCTIINVQGHKSRFRSPDDLEKIVRQNLANGSDKLFITDDNFARNRNWEPLVDRLIALRAEGVGIKLMLQVDTQSHRIPRFVSKCVAAGVETVFLGLENVNPDNLAGARKHQNLISDYRDLAQTWRNHGVVMMAGYIIGFPGDTPASVARDVEIIKRELPIDFVEFFYLTPLPGSRDHQRLVEQDVWLDPDLSKYNLNDRVTHHPRMSDEEWEKTVREAWNAFYCDDHARTLIKRAAANPKGRVDAVAGLIQHAAAMQIEGMHPIEIGTVRLRFRGERRHGMPIESRFVFYAKTAYSTLRKRLQYRALKRRMMRLCREALSAPDRFEYRDVAIDPVAPGEAQRLDLFTTAGAERELEKRRRSEEIRRLAAKSRDSRKASDGTDARVAT